ncbi:hypothetical protein Enr17x_40740 [Gimesia fumaroli]|uniref:Uncharacterized protein n=1 Tax=Gimesia fumaroli TaxID=2527976 RepID=A0A518IG11_9PLAN|nr:hypothetical protein Enr17x_40740 [Gimesia fumaroli]
MPRFNCTSPFQYFEEYLISQEVLQEKNDKFILIS